MLIYAKNIMIWYDILLYTLCLFYRNDGQFNDINMSVSEYNMSNASDNMIYRS